VKVDGNLVVTGTITQSSDARLKKNIATVDNVLDKIKQLHGVRYNWIDPANGKDTQIGFIAQEVEKVFPELVKTDDKGMKSVAYSNMTPVLLQAIKEQQVEIEELRKLVDELQKAVRTIK
jgi:hypothetical protein